MIRRTPGSTRTTLVPYTTLCLSDLLGKRQLNQNAMYGRVGVELCYQRAEFSLGAIRTVAMLERSHPDLAALLDLPAHIDVACRIVADQPRRQCRRSPVGSTEIR